MSEASRRISDGGRRRVLSRLRELLVVQGVRAKLDSRHYVLGGALLSTAVFGFPVFCLVCPIGLTFATVLVVWRLFAAGDMTWSVVLIPLLLVVELVFLRKWCTRFCPLAGLMNLVSRFSKTWRPVIDESKCLESVNGRAASAPSRARPTSTCGIPISASARWPTARDAGLRGRVSGEGGQHAVFGEEGRGISGKHGCAGRHRREDGRVMDGRTSERLRSNRSIMGVLDGVSSEAVVVHQERCAKVRNRNVAL
ncbi:MAG: hypothetical protein ACLR3C_06135 [Eggerthella lenta]